MHQQLWVSNGSAKVSEFMKPETWFWMLSTDKTHTHRHPHTHTHTSIRQGQGELDRKKAAVVCPVLGLS